MDHRAFLPLFFAFAIVACEDDEASTSGNDGGGGASSGSTSGATTSGSTTSGSTTTSSSSGMSSTGTGEAPTNGSKTGLVGVFSGASSQSDVGYSVSAGFVARPDAAPGVYVESMVGPCVIKTFSEPEVFGQKIAGSAGDVIVEGGLVPVTLSPDARNLYAKRESTAVDLYEGGETVTISATGDTVPAFTTELLAPSHVDITLPIQPADDAPLPLDRTADLVLTWDDGGFGELVVLLGDPTTSITCKFPTAAGTATIPSAALQKLAPSSLGFFLMEPASRKDLVVGEWTVQIVVASSLRWNGVADSQSFSYQASN